ncbi:MAG: DSD1 family PLP-dependent enzyme [Acidobacteria bacterium]|nr:DSD1 family PLP-dependent enzyme [Acidobacteriota bacterium]
MKISSLPTPALAVDLDLFEANIQKMQAACSQAGKLLRPHAKAHKRIEIARRQREAGAVGVCCTTLAELEIFSNAGFSVLLTTPVASSVKTDRVAALSGDVTVVVDHPFQVALYEASATRPLHVLVDLDIGDHRTGIPCDERAIELVHAIASTKHLRFGGLQAYSVSGSHTDGHDSRRAHSTQAIGRAIEVQRELLRLGFDATRLTGGSTGTWDIDIAIPELTEMQAGSYPLMDVAYRKIGGVPFGPAMTVLATVVSASHAGRVTVDAGFKAFSTDRPFGPSAARYPDATWQWAGDEHGFLLGSELPSLGEQVAFIPPHCDPTVNLHQSVYAYRGDEVVEVWPR